MKKVLRLVLFSMMLAGAACSPEPEPEQSPTISATASSPEASPAGSAAPTEEPSPIPSVTTGSSTQPFKLVDPAAAAEHLYQSWKANDRAEALKYADEKAVNELFKTQFGGPDHRFQGCTHQVDHYFCQYTYEGGALTYRVDGGVSAGYFVTEISAIAD